MSTYDYTVPAATALRLLAKFGKTISLSRTTGETELPISGNILGGSDASVDITGALFDYADRLIDGTKIKQGDRRLIMSNEQTVTMTDKPIIDGVKKDIVNLIRISPDDTTVVAYIAQVR